MKITVLGGSGLIGKQLVKLLNSKGIEAVAASPSLGVNSVTGENLEKSLCGSDVVIDVTNAKVFDNQSLLDFFMRSSQNIVERSNNANVKHIIVLSIVGTGKIKGSGYFDAKFAQERIIKNSGIGYTIVYATQFFEFLDDIIYMGSVGKEVTLSDAFFRPLASQEVASFLAEVALKPALNGTIQIAGPEQYAIAKLAEILLHKRGDERKVIIDNNAPYGGTIISKEELLPANSAKLTQLTFEEWYNQKTVTNLN